MAKSAKRELSVGVIGAGLMGRAHIAGLLQIAKRGLLPVRVGAVAERDEKSGGALARRLGCRLYASGEELIADPSIDAVVIAVPTDLHWPMVRAACAARKAIFLEKPIGRNLAEAEKIAAAIVKSGLPHQLGLVLRFSPCYTVLKSLVDDPANGRFIFCRFRDDQQFPVGPGTRYGSNWRQEADRAGGGALIEHSIHDVDALHWLFGEPKVESAIILDSHAAGIEKLAGLNLTFAGGGAAQLASVWHLNPTRLNERHIEIFFENRFLSTVGGFVSPITIQGPKGPARRIGKEEIEKRFRKMIHWADPKNADFPSTLGYEMWVFLKAVLEGGKAGAPGVAEGLAAHRLIERAYRMGKGAAKR